MKIFAASLTISLFAGWVGGMAQAQSTDYFGGLNQDDTGEITLEIENEPAKTEPLDMIVFDDLAVTITRAEIAEFRPELRNPDLVQPRDVPDNGRVMQGATLDVFLTIRGPSKKNWRRRSRLYSVLADPENPLSENVIYELGDEDDVLRDWRQSKRSDMETFVPLRSSVNFSRVNIDDATASFTGSFQIQTANLKPGKYQIWVQVFRTDDDEIVEKDTRRFNFEVVDAPLFLVADLPSSVATFDEDKSAQNVRFPVMLSDWAVPPLSAVMEASVQGVTLGHGNMETDALDGTMFDILLMPPQAYAGETTRFTLRVRDGLGRNVSLSHSIAITDGARGEIQVDMPSMVDAGDTLFGSITYPDGFTLVKPPIIADRRGFEWTNSSFTEFRIDVKEEGVNHRRLFAIVARGRLDGLDYEPVLTWKREYDVVSQNLIFDPVARQKARDKRKADADERRRVFLQAMVGDGGGETENSTGASSEETFEIVSTETFENTSGENSSGGLSSNGTSSPEGTNYIGAGGPTLDGNTKSVCGTAIDGFSFSAGVSNSGWVIDGNGESGVSEGDRYFRTIGLIQLGVPNDYEDQYNYLSYYEDDCVLESEKIARSDGGVDEYYFYSNGGRKSVFTASRDMEWDRAGNITYESSQ
jgi:hypothetical protein